MGKLQSTKKRTRRLAAIALLSPTLVGAETWPVKDFEIFIGEPGKFWGENEVEPTLPMSPEAKAEIESFLHESAVALEAMGFKSPYLEPIVDTADGRKALRITRTLRTKHRMVLAGAGSKPQAGTSHSCAASPMPAIATPARRINAPQCRLQYDSVRAGID
jgi:hypothetical protein